MSGSRELFSCDIGLAKRVLTVARTRSMEVRRMLTFLASHNLPLPAIPKTGYPARMLSFRCSNDISIIRLTSIKEYVG